MFDVDPEAVASTSINEGRLQRAIGLVGNWVDTGIVPGASLLIARGDNLVVEGYRGLADIKTKRAASRDTLWSIASITKPVTAAAVMALMPFAIDELSTITPSITYNGRNEALIVETPSATR